jgi:hypothetical protein
MSFIRTKRIKGIDYFYLVENYRVDGKVRQKVLAYLGQFNTIATAYEHWRVQSRSAKSADEKQHARQMKPYL